MSFQYKVVPFIGQISSKQTAADVAKQLESLINQQVTQGWEFYQLGDANIEVRPGCLSALLGSKVSYVRYDQVIFRKSS